MNQIQRSLLAGGVMVALAGGGIYWAQKDKEGRNQVREAKEKEKRAFPDVKSEDIVKLEIQHPSEKLTLEKTGSHWRATEPRPALAEDNTVDSMVSAVANLSFRTRFKAEEMPADRVELDKPNIKVAATLKDGRTIHIWVGRKNSFDDTAYVRAGEQPETAAVASTFAFHIAPFQKTFLDIRDKRLVVLATGDTVTLQVEVNGLKDATPFKASRIIAGEKPNWDDPWNLEEPIHARADGEEIGKTLQTLATVRAMAFVEGEKPDLKALGLDPPTFRITVQGRGRTEVVRLGRADDGTTMKYYAMREDNPVVVEVVETPFVGLIHNLLWWRDKRVVDFDRDLVREISTTLPDGKPITLVKEVQPDASIGAVTWKLTQPKEARAKGWKGSSALFGIYNFKVKSVVKDSAPTAAELETYGFNKPTQVVEVKDGAGKVLAAMLFGKRVGGDIYVMARGGTMVGLVDNGRRAELPSSVEDFEETEEGAEPGMPQQHGATPPGAPRPGPH